MNTILRSAILTLSLIIPALSLAQGCEYDTQCKDNRLCEKGQCVNPPAGVQSANPSSDSASSTSYQPPYKCDPSKGLFPDGICRPFPTEPNIPAEIRGRLYLSCLRGDDPYNASSCCDHLTRALANTFKVCSGAPNHDLRIDIKNWAEALKVLGIAPNVQ